MDRPNAPVVVLNQYRKTSSYKDEVGVVYHFPTRYQKKFATPGTRFVYYEPRNGGEQVYFGCGSLGEVWRDPEDDNHYYAEILDYQQFSSAVSYWDSAGKPRENHKTMRNSVRFVPTELYREILSEARLQTDVEMLDDEATLETIYLRAVPEQRRAIATRYERPNWITQSVKAKRGATCQVCGFEGFRTKAGKLYCEAHHLFHLCKRLPGTLSPRFLIVVCATCHRMFHHANVSEPEEIEGTWNLKLNGRQVRIPICD